MEISDFIHLAFFVIQFSVFSFAIDFDEGCYIGQQPLLQISFVMDQTGTFFGTLGNPNFFSEFTDLAPTLMDEIEKDYPGTQFALTTHADWEVSAQPEHGRGAHTRSEACYIKVTNFTTDRRQFQRNLRTLKLIGNGRRENALSALAFTAADKTLGWIRNATSAENKLLRRVLVLVTDRDTGNINNTRGRGDFKGDGTDKCKTSKPPDIKILREVLEKYQMTVIALYAMSAGSGNLLEIYKKHFDEVGSNIPYCGRVFSLKRNGNIVTNVKNVDQIPKDFWRNQKEMFDLEEKDEIVDPSKESRSTLFEGPVSNEKAGQIKDIIQFVKDCLRITKREGCLFGDPEGFNTLGL